jgi:hypothetical protein
LGFGLGYTAEAIREKAGNRPIIIVERHKSVLKKALETRHLVSFLSKDPIIFVIGEAPDGVIGALHICESLERHTGKSSAPCLIRNRALMKLDEDWYAEVERHSNTWISKEDVNMATLRRFGRRWIRNLVHNMEAIRDLPGVGRLRMCIDSTIPVFLAAAGPSLDGIVPFLPEIYKRAVVVGVDTSLRLLLEAGIDPDFVVVVDPQYWNSRHLDRAPAPRTCLIAESAVYPSVLRHPFQRAFLCASLFPLGGFIEDRLDPKGKLGAGGSVATTAWDFARILGTASIWIAGLDLAFPGFKTHFKGALFEERALAESTRFNPTETRSLRALQDGKPFWAPAAAGGSVLTDRRLSLYAAWFENHFKDAPALSNYRLSEEGLAIPGLLSVSVEEMLALPVRRQEIHHLLDQVFSEIEADFSKQDQRTLRSSQYKTALGALLQGLEQITVLAEEAVKITGAAYQKYRTGSLQSSREQEILLKKLDETNKRIAKSAVKDVAGFLFPSVTELEAMLESPQSESFMYYLEYSLKLYQSLSEAAGYNLKILQR